MANWLAQLAPVLEQRKALAAVRSRRASASAQGPEVVHAGRRLLNFSSNDYLGLAAHPRVIEAFTGAAAEHGVGSGASHLVVGHHQLHQQLEQRLAELTGRERALVFSSGYMANLGVLQTLLGKGDTLFQDRLNHASLVDGGLACKAQQWRYRHKDMQHLETLLQSRARGRAMIVTDGVFSMDGDLAPLANIASLAERYAAVLMVDDAHGFGVLGDSGAGSAELAGLNAQQLPILMGTLGKAMGVAGAFVAGSETLVETLLQTSRNYIYTTALPPACAAAALAALQVNASEPQRRAHLQALVRYFQQACAARGINVGSIEQGLSPTPIQPLIVGSNSAALALADYLYQRNILVVAIRPPTVPPGSARLRISFSASHTRAQVDQLLDVLQQGVLELGLAA
ncbi:MAG: 8-amino-7-oxononanoate synthase [Pseudomonadales bacterium]|nr:8-amino-7-oxononanoate synthase [Pseudomonadales bacterium]